MTTNYRGFPHLSARFRPEYTHDEWRDSAACLYHDPELFFAEGSAGVREAKAICRGCHVQIPCLIGALERQEEFGVWGGQLFVKGTPVDRDHRNGNTNPPTPRNAADVEHGTQAAIKWHKRNGTDLCERCVVYREAKRPNHGTRKGHRYHLQYGEQPCAKCASAWSAGQAGAS